jgi:hypothetical protein
MRGSIAVAVDQTEWRATETNIQLSQPLTPPHECTLSTCRGSWVRDGGLVISVKWQKGCYDIPWMPGTRKITQKQDVPPTQKANGTLVRGEVMLTRKQY